MLVRSTHNNCFSENFFKSNLDSLLQESCDSAEEALRNNRDPIRTFSEISFGEVLLERCSFDLARESSKVAFAVRSSLISAASYILMSWNCKARQSVLGNEYVERTLQELNSLLTSVTDSRLTSRYTHSIRGSFELLGREFLARSAALVDGRSSLAVRDSYEDRLWDGVKALLGQSEEASHLRLYCALNTLLFSGRPEIEQYRSAFQTLISLPYPVANLGRVIESNYHPGRDRFDPGLASIVVAASISKILSSEDRILGLQVDVYRRGENTLQGDIDLVLKIDKRSRSGLRKGIHFVEVKYLRAMNALLEFNMPEVRKGIQQLARAHQTFSKSKIPIHRDIALYSSLKGEPLFRQERDKFVDVDLFRVASSSEFPNISQMQMDQMCDRLSKTFTSADLFDLIR